MVEWPLAEGLPQKPGSVDKVEKHARLLIIERFEAASTEESPKLVKCAFFLWSNTVLVMADSAARG